MYIPCELDFFTQQPESVVMEGSKRKRSDNEGSTTAKKSRPSSTPILEVVYLMHMFDIATLSSLTFAWVGNNFCLGKWSWLLYFSAGARSELWADHTRSGKFYEHCRFEGVFWTVWRCVCSWGESKDTRVCVCVCVCMCLHVSMSIHCPNPRLRYEHVDCCVWL